jgi:hypothetical protein
MLLIYPERTWAAVPANEKYDVRDRVNDALTKEGIRKVGDDIIGWRMAIAVRDLKQSSGMCSYGMFHSAKAYDRLARTIARPSTDPPAAVAAVSEPMASRSFDPIRDI